MTLLSSWSSSSPTLMYVVANHQSTPKKKLFLLCRKMDEERRFTDIEMIPGCTTHSSVITKIKAEKDAWRFFPRLKNSPLKHFTADILQLSGWNRFSSDPHQVDMLYIYGNEPPWKINVGWNLKKNGLFCRSQNEAHMSILKLSLALHAVLKPKVFGCTAEICYCSSGYWGWMNSESRLFLCWTKYDAFREILFRESDNIMNYQMNKNCNGCLIFRCLL